LLSSDSLISISKSLPFVKRLFFVSLDGASFPCPHRDDLISLPDSEVFVNSFFSEDLKCYIKYIMTEN